MFDESQNVVWEYKQTIGDDSSDDEEERADQSDFGRRKKSVLNLSTASKDAARAEELEEVRRRRRHSMWAPTALEPENESSAVRQLEESLPFASSFRRRLTATSLTQAGCEHRESVTFEEAVSAARRSSWANTHASGDVDFPHLRCFKLCTTAEQHDEEYSRAVALEEQVNHQLQHQNVYRPFDILKELDQETEVKRRVLEEHQRLHHRALARR